MTKRTVYTLATSLMLMSLVLFPAVQQSSRTASAQAVVAPTRIMPLGDSITLGAGVPEGGGYRIDLSQKFVANNYSVDFVGSQMNGPATLADKDHEGHSGYTIDQLSREIVPWLVTYRPDIILLMIGTNDIQLNLDLPNAPNRLSALIDQITTTLPTAQLLVASITPLGDPELNQKAIDYNAAIPGIVSQKSAQGKRVTYVDLYSALTTSDLADGLHPNAAGYSKMATRWYDTLVSRRFITPTTATPTVSPTVTNTATATATTVLSTATATVISTPVCPVVTDFKGVQNGDTLSGAVNVEALVTGQNITQVVFDLDGPARTQVIERFPPYTFEAGGIQDMFDTTQFPNGEYTLKATATNQAGCSTFRTVVFRIANGTPTATSTPTLVPATATPASTATASPTVQPATATPASTATVQPATATPASTATVQPTVQPATATPASTATVQPTVQPATATPTSTPAPVVSAPVAPAATATATTPAPPPQSGGSSGGGSSEPARSEPARSEPSGPPAATSAAASSPPAPVLGVAAISLGAYVDLLGDGRVLVRAPGRRTVVTLETGTIPHVPDQWCARDRIYRSHIRLEDVGIAGATFGVEPNGYLDWIPEADAGCVDWSKMNASLNFPKEVIMEFKLLQPRPGALLWVLDGDAYWRGRLYEVTTDGQAHYIARPYWDANQEHFRDVWKNLMPVSWMQMDDFQRRGFVGSDLVGAERIAVQPKGTDLVTGDAERTDLIPAEPEGEL